MWKIRGSISAEHLKIYGATVMLLLLKTINIFFQLPGLCDPGEGDSKLVVRAPYGACISCIPLPFRSRSRSSRPADPCFPVRPGRRHRCFTDSGDNRSDRDQRNHHQYITDIYVLICAMINRLSDRFAERWKYDYSFGYSKQRVSQSCQGL
jgi:hypothetical protein